MAFQYLSNGISTLVGVQAEASRAFLDSSFSHTHIQCINKSCYTFPSKYFQTGTTSYSLPSNHNHLGSGKHSLWTITNSLPNWSLFACLPLIQDQLQHKTQSKPLKIEVCSKAGLAQREVRPWPQLLGGHLHHTQRKCPCLGQGLITLDLRVGWPHPTALKQGVAISERSI